MSTSAHGHQSNYQGNSAKLAYEGEIEKRIQARIAKDGIRIREFFIDFDKLRKGTVGEAAVSSLICAFINCQTSLHRLNLLKSCLLCPVPHVHWHPWRVPDRAGDEVAARKVPAEGRVRPCGLPHARQQPRHRVLGLCQSERSDPERPHLPRKLQNLANQIANAQNSNRCSRMQKRTK